MKEVKFKVVSKEEFSKLESKGILLSCPNCYVKIRYPGEELPKNFNYVCYNCRTVLVPIPDI